MRVAHDMEVCHEMLTLYSNIVINPYNGAWNGIKLYIHTKLTPLYDNCTE